MYRTSQSAGNQRLSFGANKDELYTQFAGKIFNLAASNGRYMGHIAILVKQSEW